MYNYLYFIFWNQRISVIWRTFTISLFGADSEGAKMCKSCRSRKHAEKWVLVTVVSIYLQTSASIQPRTSRPNRYQQHTTTRRVISSGPVAFSGNLLIMSAFQCVADWDSTWAVLIAPVDPWGKGRSNPAYQPTVSPKFRKMSFLKRKFCAEFA